jgi:uncharacterized protein YuzE
MMKTTISIDEQSGELGSVYVRFSEAAVAKTIPGKNPDDPDVLIDVDAKGQIVGVELLNSDVLRNICASIVKGVPAPYKAKVSELCLA